ncbi:hypothetical protein LSAT2_002613 [Lamellibrachia satsuma]|nr:hypothetical protein LSAT2_002613 [Lamellibrachia satsuma]
MPKSRNESSSCKEQNTTKLLEILNNESVGENLAERVATIVAEKINNGLDNMEELLADKELEIQHLEQTVQKMASTIEKKLSRKARALKKDGRTNDCWTANRHIMVKDTKYVIRNLYHNQRVHTDISNEACLLVRLYGRELGDSNRAFTHIPKDTSVARLSQRFLRVTASSTPIERIVSTADKIFRPNHARMTDTHFEVLMYAK